MADSVPFELEPTQLSQPYSQQPASQFANSQVDPRRKYCEFTAPKTMLTPRGGSHPNKLEACHLEAALVQAEHPGWEGWTSSAE